MTANEHNTKELRFEPVPIAHIYQRCTGNGTLYPRNLLEPRLRCRCQKDANSNQEVAYSNHVEVRGYP